MSSPQKHFYKGQDSDFVIFIDDEAAAEKFQKGDGTVPLIEIVSIYKVFTTRTGGAEGKLDEASKAELDNEFGTSSVDEVIKKILKEGSNKHGVNLRRGGSSTNDSMGAGDTGN
ncbi:restriction of telomere capping protein 3 [[Candida] railenensis]|uniref:Restriction of telomere capping protein 3 n=1 Tax=[Candida] railenensis TaxID=45579 RepID=A0A9P0QUQ4_9ASCO|nr:restriction of telomere capping protein 3 [[Candida] railenensis]